MLEISCTMKGFGPQALIILEGKGDIDFCIVSAVSVYTYLMDQ